MAPNSIEFNFYHLTTTNLDKALFKLLEKIYSLNLAVKILCQNEEQLGSLDQALWSLGRISFLPHATDKDPKPDKQPILLSCDNNSNLNKATILINLANMEEDYPNYAKILFIFDGNNPIELAKARERWKNLAAQDYKLVYYKQDEKGNWLKNE